MNFKKNLPILIFSSIIFSFRAIFVYLGKFIFSWDSARDMLWIRQLIIQHKPFLVGPWGSLKGTFFGPLYYYLIAIPVYIFQGSPKAAVGTIVFFLTLMILISYVFGKKYLDENSGILFALFFAFTSYITYLSLFAFSQNLIPFVYLIFLITQWLLINKPTLAKFILLFFLSAMFFHLEPVDTLPSLITSGLIVFYLWKNKKIKNIIMVITVGLISFIIPFIPNIVFDLRHNFLQLSGFLTFFSGKDKSLLGSLPIFARFVDRLQQFFFMFLSTFFRDYFILGRIFTLLLISFLIINAKKLKLILSKNTKHFNFIKLILFNLLVLFIYFLILSPLLKDYYLYSLPVFYILILGTLLSLIIKAKLITKNLVFIIVFSILGFNVVTLLKAKFNRSENNEIFSVQQFVVDEIYKLANNNPFSVYTYTNYIYDYPYQYLFSWYGNKKYKYIPVDYAYLPNQPEYVLDKDLFDGRKNKLTANGNNIDIFLILTPSDHASYTKEKWLNTFPLKDIVLDQYVGEFRIIQIKQSEENYNIREN